MTAAITILVWMIISGLVGYRVFRYTADPPRRRYCVACQNTTLWHPDSGCDVCRWDANS